MGFCDLVPVRQSVLHAAERRRARQTIPGQEQPVARVGHATPSRRARVQHTRNAQSSAVLGGRYIFEQRPRVPPVRVAGSARGFGPFTVGCSNGTYVTAPGINALPECGRRAGRCCCICRHQSDGVARDAAEPPTSATRTRVLRSRTSGRPGPDDGELRLRWDGQRMPRPSIRERRRLVAS